MSRKIELLAPAKNVETGMAAIRHGADAVYIGAENFGARTAASNSMHDIEKLAHYAHQFNAKVYLTLNTLFYDHEIESGIKTAFEAYNIGVDALIIQDFGLIEMGLPPLPIHASTQMHNISLERIKFLESIGFTRVVLPREMSINQIADIAQNTNIELEYFIHGALCVSYSGQCYLSAYLGGRSANRGNCAQACRMPFDVLDKSKKLIDSQKHVLSLKDLNLDQHIAEILNSGIMSLKIEGRLKNIPYVINIVNHYRRIVDNILENNNLYKKASSGKIIHSFIPDPNKTFNRTYTELNVNGRQSDIYNPNSPKSFGEFVGVVTKKHRNAITIDSEMIFSNGDGLCYLDKNGILQGFIIHKVEGKTVYSDTIGECFENAEMYRNKDVAFEKVLANEKTKRLISTSLKVNFDKYITIFAEDEDGNKVSLTSDIEYEIAHEAERSKKTMEEQFTKTGDTIFLVENLDFFGNEIPFLRISELNTLRRSVFELLLFERIKNYPKESSKINLEIQTYPEQIIEKQHNILNSYAKRFLEKRGAKIVSMSAELNNDYRNLALMTTHHCLKFEYGHCQKYPNPSIQSTESPAFLKLNQQLFKLEYDCKNCQMELIVS